MAEDNLIADSLSTFVDRKGPSEWSAQLVNPTRPKEIQNMAEDLFGSLGMEVPEREIEGIEENLLLMIRDGEVVASSPLKVIENTLLMVNSDLYTTGTKSIHEVSIPDTVQALSDTVFTLSGGLV